MHVSTLHVSVFAREGWRAFSLAREVWRAFSPVRERRLIRRFAREGKTHLKITVF